MQEELDEIRRLADLPLLLDLETAEKVFSHKSLFARPAHVHVENEEPQDYDRFAFLGDQVLSFVATEVVFERYPNARPSFLTEKRALVTKNEELAKWSSAYKLPQRLVAHPSQLAVVQSSILVRASIFEAYVGAVFSESGLDLVSHWVKLLIRRVLDLDDFAQRTPRSELSPLPSRVDSDAGTDDMDERIIFRVNAMSIAGSDSTGVGGGTGGYDPSMNQFRNRSIAPSSHDGSLNTPATTTSSFLNAANDQPITVATGRRNEIRDYDPGRYSPNVPGHHSPSQLLLAPNSQYAPDTRPNVPSYTHRKSAQSPPFLRGDGSNRSSSSNTVRPPARTPQDSPSTTKATVSPSESSPFVTGSSRSGFTSSGFASSGFTSSGQSDFSTSSTRSVAGGYLALFNQMATQKKEKVEWKISSSGPPHKPKFDAQVFISDYCHGRGQALTKKQAQQSAAEAALRSLGWVGSACKFWPKACTRTPLFWTRADVRAWQHRRSRIFVPERQIQSLFRLLFLRKK